VAPGDAGDLDFVEAGQARDAISLCNRQHDPHMPTDLDQSCEGVGNALIQTERAAEQRAPREEHKDKVGRAVQLRRHGLCRGDDKQRVGQTTLRRRSSRTPGRLGHRRGVGIDTEDERPWLPARRCQNRAAITRTQVDDHPLGAGDPIGDLADVHLGDPPARDDTHGRRSVLARRSAPTRTYTLNP
jgi:hypothetical protein